MLDEGEGHPVLFLHGMGGCWRDWEPQLDHLSGPLPLHRDRAPGPRAVRAPHGRVQHRPVRRRRRRRAGPDGRRARLRRRAQHGRDDRPEAAAGRARPGRRARAVRHRAHMGRRATDYLVAVAREIRDHGFPDSRGAVRAEGSAFSRWTVEHQPHVARTNMREAEANDPDCWARAAMAVARHDTAGRHRPHHRPHAGGVGEEDQAVPLELAQPLVDALGGATAGGAGRCRPRVQPRPAGRVRGGDRGVLRGEPVPG